MYTQHDVYTAKMRNGQLTRDLEALESRRRSIEASIEHNNSIIADFESQNKPAQEPVAEQKQEEPADPQASDTVSQEAAQESTQEQQ